MNPEDQKMMEMGHISDPAHPLVALVICVLVGFALAYAMDKVFDWIWHEARKHRRHRGN